MTSDAVMSTGPALSIDRDDGPLARTTMRRVSFRLLGLLFVVFIFNYLDRTNVAIAGLQMRGDLRFSDTAFGIGTGMFFLGYAPFEIPSNLFLARVGARRWIARIIVSWGIIAAAMIFVRTPAQFYALRFLLGVAEAGFFPGIIYYLGQWFPAAHRARAISLFLVGLPLANIIGGSAGGVLLGLDGAAGLRGWQWLFLVEGIPSVLLGFAVLRLLTDRIDEARWLSPEQRTWLTARLERDREESPAAGGEGMPPLRALLHPTIWRLTIAYFLFITANYSYTFWAPTIIKDVLRTTNMQTGFVLATISCVTTITMLLLGVSSDRSQERCLHVAACAFLAALGYVGAALAPSPVIRVASFAGAGIFATAFFPVFWCLPTMLLRGTAAAVGIAFVNSIGNLGGFAGPTFVGVLKDSTGGTTGSFLVLAGVAALAGGLVVSLRYGGSRAVFTRARRARVLDGRATI